MRTRIAWSALLALFLGLASVAFPPQALAGNACKRAEEAIERISASRNAVLRQIKRDAGLPQTLEPINVRRVPMTDGSGRAVLDEFHQPIMTREYDFVRPSDGRRITIQEHTAGHQFPDGGGETPHFNARLTEDTRHSTVPGTQSHYYVDVGR